MYLIRKLSSPAIMGAWCRGGGVPGAGGVPGPGGSSWSRQGSVVS